jgi:hypothetical protein
MFKKLNVETLIIILVILGGIYYLTTITGNKDRSFRDVLVSIDTAEVTDIVINIPKEDLTITLSRTGESKWEVSGNGNTYPAQTSVVKGILAHYDKMEPKRIAATSEDKWDAYEVSDSTGTRVTLKNEGDIMADVYIGKFSYSQPPQAGGQPNMQQQRGTMTSFVRLAGEDKTFAVEDFLKMSYQNDINAYRNKSLVQVDKNSISKIDFDYPDRKIELTKEEGKWMMNGSPADSANTVKYLNKIARLNSSNFVDLSTQKISDATHRVTIEGSNFTPVLLKAFPAADTNIKYVVTSSINPGAEFDGSKAKLYEKVFVDETAFLPDME